MNPSRFASVWKSLVGGGFQGTEQQRQLNIAILRDSIRETIKELSHRDMPFDAKSYVASYQALLDSLPESTIRPVKSQRQAYTKALSERYPATEKPWFSEETANTLGVIARLAMLSPVPAPQREQPGIEKAVNAEFQRKAAAHAAAERAARFDSPDMTSEQKMAVTTLIPGATAARILTKHGVNTAYQVIDEAGRKSFVKTFFKEDEKHFLSGDDAKLTQHFAAKHESAASTLANFVTGGLVPRGEPYQDTIVYPLLDINHEATSRVFTHKYPNYGYENVYTRLTPSQRSELFAHMLSDMVLLNPDTHSGQFAIDTQGHLVSFDKGRAYFDAVFKNKNLRAIQTPSDFIATSKIYREFAAELKKHPNDLKAILADPKVQETFLNLDTLTMDSEQPTVKQLLTPLFAFTEHKTGKDLSESYFSMISNIPKALAIELGISATELVKKSTKPEVNILTDSGYTSLTFDPKLHHVVSVAARDLGFPRGLAVQDIVQKSGGIAGMSGGFFAEGPGAQSGVGWIWSKVKQKTGVGETQAFPIAILRSKSRLLSDTSDFQPTVAWSEDGSRAEIGEVKTVWEAKLSPEGPAILLNRRTDINVNEPESTIYFKDGSQLKSITIENGQVKHIEEITEPDMNKPNGYWLERPSPETVAQFNALNPGDSLNYEYRMEAKDPAQAARMAELPFMVSGGQILMSNGEIDPRVNESYGRGSYAGHIGAAFCIHGDGQVSLVVKPGDEPASEFVRRLKKLGVEKAISMDGGGTPTAVMMGPDGALKYEGYNRVVADAFVVMPKERRTLSAELARKEGPLFAALKQESLSELENLLESEPVGIHAVNQNKQGLLQSHLASRKSDPEIIELLLSKMSPEDLMHQDQLGDTVVHTALHMGQRDLAKRMIATLGEDSDIWITPGRGGRRISQIDDSLTVPQKIIIREVLKGLVSSDSQVREAAQKEIEQWIAKGEHISDLLNLTQAEMLSPDQDVRGRAFNLFFKLFERGHAGIPEAIAAASQGAQSSDYIIRFHSLNLFAKLFEKNQGFPEAVAAASQGAQSSDASIRPGSLELFKKLVEKNQGFPEAIAAASQGAQSSDASIRSGSLNLFAKLFEKNQGFPEAVAAASLGMQSSNTHIRSSSLDLFSKLVEKGHGFQEAIVAASQGMQSSDYIIRFHSLNLFEKLVEKGHGFQEAIVAASQGMQSSDTHIRSGSLELFKKLFEKNQGFPEAAAAASQGMQSSDYTTRMHSQSLFEKLFEKNQGFQEAAAAASQGIQSSDYIIRFHSLDLFSKLVEKGHGFQEAIVAASLGMQSSNTHIRSKSLDLLQQLRK